MRRAFTGSSPVRQQVVDRLAHQLPAARRGGSAPDSARSRAWRAGTASRRSASSTSSLVARPTSNCWRRMRRFSSAWPTAASALRERGEALRGGAVRGAHRVLELAQLALDPRCGSARRRRAPRRAGVAMRVSVSRSHSKPTKPVPSVVRVDDVGGRVVDRAAAREARQAAPRERRSRSPRAAAAPRPARAAPGSRDTRCGARRRSTGERRAARGRRRPAVGASIGQAERLVQRPAGLVDRELAAAAAPARRSAGRPAPPAARSW